MATPAEALAKMRAMCLALPDTTEGDHFGTVAFYVKKKMFATAGPDKKNGNWEIIFGLEPAHAAALMKKDARFKPYARDKRAVVVDVADVNDWSEIEPYLLESYAMRAPAQKAKPTKKATKSAPKKTTRKKKV